MSVFFKLEVIIYWCFRMFSGGTCEYSYIFSNKILIWIIKGVEFVEHTKEILADP